MPVTVRCSLLSLAVASSALTGCTDAVPDEPGVTPGITTTITITSGLPLALVAFHDGLDGRWETATKKSSTAFEIAVHGPYVVAAVCETGIGAGGFTWQAARTLEDPHEVLVPCNTSRVRHMVTGRMTQDGWVQLGQDASRPVRTNQDFQLPVPDGTYDLIATTADRIAIRRALTVRADLALTPPVDVTQEGVPLVDISFTVPNAEPDDTLEVAVGLLTAANPVIPARIYTGPPATAKAAPGAALTTTDIQSASVRAVKGPQLRSLRRPFQMGGDTAYTLPPPIGDPRWTIEDGQLVASWSSVPDGDRLFVEASASASPFNAYTLDISPGFLAAVRVTRVVLDTRLPGYKPEWQINPTVSYTRRLFAQQGQIATSVVTTSSWTETIAGQ
jgi:hypothetical protein